MKKTTGYKHYSQIYDKFYSTHVDTDFLNRVWKPSWKAILEVGVGQGRLIPYFTSHDIEQFVGLDISDEMLAKIPQKYLSDNSIQCMSCDFLKYEDDRKFDLILYTFNTFNYMLTQEEAHRHLSQCCHYLKDDGVIYLDMTFPVCLREGIGTVSKTQVKEGNKKYILETQHLYEIKESREQRVFKCEVYDNQEKINSWEWQVYRRYYTIEEMISLARISGFSPIHLEMYLSEDKTFYDGYYLLLKRNLF